MLCGNRTQGAGAWRADASNPVQVCRDDALGVTLRGLRPPVGAWHQGRVKWRWLRIAVEVVVDAVVFAVLTRPFAVDYDDSANGCAAEVNPAVIAAIVMVFGALQAHLVSVLVQSVCGWRHYDW